MPEEFNKFTIMNKWLQQKFYMSSDTQSRILRIMLSLTPGLNGPAIYDLVLSIKNSEDEFEKQIHDAIESLQNTSKLIQNLEERLQERTDRLNNLQNEYLRYSQLSQIEEEKSIALLNQIELTLDGSRTKERWIALIISLLAGLIIFILGIILGPSLTQLWNSFLNSI